MSSRDVWHLQGWTLLESCDNWAYSDADYMAAQTYKHHWHYWPVSSLHLCVRRLQNVCVHVYLNEEHSNSVQTPALSSGCYFPIIHIPISYTDILLNCQIHSPQTDELKQWTLTDVAELGGVFMRVCDTSGSEKKT